MRDGLKEEEAHLRWRAAGQLFRWALWWRCRAVLGLFPKRVHAHRQRQSQENLIQFMHTCSALKLLSIQLSWWVKATYALAAMRGLKCRKVISFNLSVWPDTSTPLTRFSGLKQSWAHKVSLKWLKPLQLKIPFSKHTRQKNRRRNLAEIYSVTSKLYVRGLQRPETVTLRSSEGSYDNWVKEEVLESSI